jgi:hypothetical protein
MNLKPLWGQNRDQYLILTQMVKTWFIRRSVE